MSKLKYTLLILFVCISILSCRNESPYILHSEASINSIDSSQDKFLMYEDSTFSFTSITQDGFRNHYKSETFKGKLKIINDTIFPILDNNFFFIEANKAVLKNGFMDFYDQFNFLKLRLKIIKSDLNQISNIDFNDYPDYSLFNRNSSTDSIKYYDLKLNELIKVDSIINNSISKNKETNLKKEDYIKQLTVYKNIEDEIIVVCDLYCKDDEHTVQYFQYTHMQMFDGGICNGGLVINLTKNTVSELSFAGNP